MYMAVSGRYTLPIPSVHTCGMIGSAASEAFVTDTFQVDPDALTLDVFQLDADALGAVQSGTDAFPNANDGGSETVIVNVWFAPTFPWQLADGSIDVHVGIVNGSPDPSTPSSRMLNSIVRLPVAPGSTLKTSCPVSDNVGRICGWNMERFPLTKVRPIVTFCCSSSLTSEPLDTCAKWTVRAWTDASTLHTSRTPVCKNEIDGGLFTGSVTTMKRSSWERPSRVWLTTNDALPFWNGVSITVSEPSMSNDIACTSAALPSSKRHAQLWPPPHSSTDSLYVSCESSIGTTVVPEFSHVSTCRSQPHSLQHAVGAATSGADTYESSDGKKAGVLNPPTATCPPTRLSRLPLLLAGASMQSTSPSDTQRVSPHGFPSMRTTGLESVRPKCSPRIVMSVPPCADTSPGLRYLTLGLRIATRSSRGTMMRTSLNGSVSVAGSAVPSEIGTTRTTLSAPSPSCRSSQLCWYRMVMMPGMMRPALKLYETSRSAGAIMSPVPTGASACISRRRCTRV
mmetsp:Transcript_37270/g.87677  ORF Transcript_37270/g.87677 Transcript_37270/m.87677 type:complete len:511 (-) Transcript_37270:6312-7844(-)